ncbi:unnamed protein product [Orchesella dallaii]|uniref:Odorant receptor n=1 Tax=Orchesella dallaii TaxID=48710 RepID=A0ABP1RVA0_9HEXA
MLRDGGLLTSLIQTTADFSLVTGKNLTWDERKHLLSVNSKGFFRSGVAGAILGALQLSNLLFKSYNRKPGTDRITPEITLGIYFSASYLCCQSFFSFSILFFKAEFEAFINAAYRFEVTHAKEIRDMLKMTANRRMIAIAKFYTGITRQAGTKLASFVIALLAVLMPSMPMNFFSFPPGQYLMDLVGFMGLPENIFCLIFIALTFVINWIAWILLVKFGVIGMNRAMIGAASLAVYITVIKRKLEPLSSFSSDSKYKQSLASASMSYKEIQILVTIFNQVHSGILVSILVNMMIFLVLGAVNIVKATAVGRFLDYHSVTLNLYFVQNVFLTTIIIFAVFGVCGNVHFESCRELARMKRVVLGSGRNRKLMEKSLKGLPVLKIEFGATNFVEKRTPFVYVEFALARMVENLLLSKR